MMGTLVCRNGILFRQRQKCQCERLYVSNRLILFTEILSELEEYLYVIEKLFIVILLFLDIPFAFYIWLLQVEELFTSDGERKVVQRAHILFIQVLNTWYDRVYYY
jgi:hypothetical protein